MIEKKSPITDKPLRQAGQSVSEELQRIVFDKILGYYFIAGFMVAIAAFEWIKHWSGARPNPWFYTVIAVGISGYAFFRISREMKAARHYKQGLSGEKVVGEFLDRLRGKGYRVYHDIPGDGWNIDHVIICTRGVFTVETKTRSKPLTGEPLIVFDGKSVSVDSGPQDEGPIRQSLAQSKALRTMLKEWTGRDYPVRSVVVFPGWYVRHDAGSSNSDVWVLNPKALHKWIENEDECIPVDRVKQAATALSKHVRSSDG